jgi:hypothetical protein
MIILDTNLITSDYKDAFISYGRRQSLYFVARLHRRLRLIDYDTWFDKVNIPDGDDYAQRINHGIESAHNFIYVMAPRCLTSPYCLLELEYARLLGKRVIPINQMVIFDTPEQDLSAGDQQVMVNFYKFFNLPNQNIRTTQEVLNRSHALVGKTDWLDAKEKLSENDCQRLADWAQPYENKWAKHEDLDYLKSVDFFDQPMFGESIDALEGVVERLIAVLERQKDYVHTHTDILAHALHWQKNQKATQHLLVGKERQAAEEWLLTEFLGGKQPPCQPTALVCEYICEARKNAENLMTDIFICYDTQDKDIRNSVIQSLSRHAKTTWIHDQDIQKGADYGRAIEQGIENADNFFFFISPYSVVSEYCRRELDHALQYNKRIVPLLIAPTPESDIPDVLRELQYVDFTDNTCQADYDSDIDDILNILRRDHEYFEQHKILLTRGIKWEIEGRKSAFLLRGHNLDNAQTWLRLNEKREQHPPLPLHQELITASEAAKGQLGTDVFLSYSRTDADFARMLNTALQEADKNTWFDQESISTGVDFEKEIFKGIDSADNFVFVLSPDAVSSEYCEREVNYAADNSKRFITVLHRTIDPNTMPDALRKINWIDFKDTAFEKSFPELIQAIELDREHAHQHTVLQQRASDWAENNRSINFLLNITACANAESWQAIAVAERKRPVPTELQRDFIIDSRKAIKKANRRRNALLTLAVFGMVAAGILAIFAFNKMNEANQAEQLRQKELIRSSWISLKPSTISYEECGTWLEFGVRDLYCRIKPFVDYRKLIAIVGLPIFRSGPHSKSEINLEGGYQFGYYNPEFLKWIQDNAIIDPDNDILKQGIQAAYDDKIRVLARAFYQAHKILFVSPMEFKAFGEKYQKSKVVYQEKLRTHEVNEIRFESEPLEFEQIKGRYLKRIQNKSVPAEEIGNSVQEDCRFLADYLATINEDSYEREEERINYSYMANVGGGFWVRRSIDGTEKRFFAILVKLLEIYDADWLQSEQ